MKSKDKLKQLVWFSRDFDGKEEIVKDLEDILDKVDQVLNGIKELNKHELGFRYIMFEMEGTTYHLSKYEKEKPLPIEVL